MDITMKKNQRNSNIAFNNFQELVFCHSRDLVSSKYSKLIETGPAMYSAKEIIENNEIEIFRAFRTYTNTNDTCAEVPKTPILAYLYLFNEFCTCHCKMVAQSIYSK